MEEHMTGGRLLELSGGFLTPRIVLTAAELGVFSRLEAGPKTVNDLCAAEGWDPRGLRILMDALTALGLLVTTTGGAYTLHPSVTDLLGTDPHRSVLPMILHRVRMWNTWSNLTEIVRTGVNTAAGTLRSRPLEDLEAFIGAMQVIGRDVAVKIAGLIDLSPFRRLLDVGGGSGVYTAAFLGAAPHLTAAVFDLPEVVDITRKWLSAAGLLDRVEIVPGDFHVDDLPGGYDLVLLSAIIHSNSPEGNRDLYAKAFRSLNPGGTILIRDYVMDETRTIPPEGAV
ncbi:MAG: methyltransferase, partial [Pseudomonadota bacterium]